MGGGELTEVFWFQGAPLPTRALGFPREREVVQRDGAMAGQDRVVNPSLMGSQIRGCSLRQKGIPPVTLLN